jgi:hypothetical protein
LRVDAAIHSPARGNPHFFYTIRLRPCLKSFEEKWSKTACFVVELRYP